ncbi:hypothetical protein [Streptomyces jumonjinensis]|uniref:hypothetical protein n=1 Tax=Streptomyces jumonjinensis TaxID=1945 RepID=UPI00129736A7|nr:hypothetical protein [Streptomyces jumonjinensis]
MMDVVDSWVTPGSDVYVEVAHNLATAFRAAASRAGGWTALADRHFQPVNRFAHTRSTVEGAHAWLMGDPLDDAGPDPCPQGPHRTEAPGHPRRPAHLHRAALLPGDRALP